MLVDMKQLGQQNRLRITPTNLMLELQVKRCLPVTRFCAVLYGIYALSAIIYYLKPSYYLNPGDHDYAGLIMALLFMGALVLMIPIFLISSWEATRHALVFERLELGDLACELNKGLRSALDSSGDDQKAIRYSPSESPTL